MKYLLPCQCGEGVPVDASQAGSSVVCPCGKSLEVPTLRGLRELKPLQTSDEPVAARNWSPMRGAIFASALLGMLAGLALAGYGYNKMQSVAHVTVEQEQQIFAQTIDQTPPDALYDQWRLVREQGFGPKGNNPYVKARQYRSKMKAVVGLGAGLCVLGLFGIVGPLLLGRQSQDAK